MQHEALRIGDERIATEIATEIRSPFDGSVVGTVSLAGHEHLDLAIGRAHARVRDGRRWPRHRRAEVLDTTARLIEQRAEELATLIVHESGKPLRFARAEVARAAITFRLGAAEAVRFGGEVMPVDLETRGEGRLCLFERVSRGVVGAIAPFNFPLNLVAHKLAPAFALGAPVVLKPPPQSPLISFRLAELLDEAGLPPWMLSVVPADPEIAQALATDDRIAVLSFTGSAEVGWKLKSLAGKKQVLLELGGNAPCIVDAGIDVESVATTCALAAFAQAGQVCIKVQRLMVHTSLYDAFETAFVRATEALRCGDPRDPETVVGPLIEPRHVERVMTWIAEAVKRGARKLFGGERYANVVTPTVLVDVPTDAKVSCEEVFGPVVILERFGTFDAAIERANDSRYGLQAGVFTRDLSSALRAFRELEFGGVIINDVPTFRIDNFPYGGTKDSGFGREGVRFAMEEMSEPRVLVMRG